MSLYNKESGYGKHTQSYPFMGGGQVFVVARNAAAGRQVMQDTFKGFNGGNRYFATVDAAINATTANRGDVIYVCPNHTETFTAAAGFALDVAGVSVIGLGSGNNRPTFTISSTDNAGTITQSGNNTVLKNIVVVTNDDALTNAVVVSGDNCYTEFEHQDTSAAIEAATVVRGDTANNWTLKLKHLGFTTGNAMVSTIRLDDCDNVDIEVDAYGVMTTAIVEMVDVLSTNVKVKGNFYVSGTTDLSKNVVDTITSSTWWVEGFDGAAGAAFSGGSGNAVAVGDLSAIASDVTTIKGNVGGTDSATNVLGADDADNQFASTNVAANEDGTVLERLEQLQEAVNKGTGTALAANKSLVDALGTDGNATTDSAVGLVGIIGSNTATTAFDSTNVVANKDGNVLERLENLEATIQKTIAKVQTTPSGGADALFTITGGPIHVVSIWGVVTTVLVGAANGTLQATTTDPAATTAMSTTVAIDNDAKGTVYTFVGPTGVLTPTTLGLTLIDMGSTTLTETQYIVPIGNINFLTSGALTGAITWYMSYIPSPGAVVVAA